MLFIRSQPPIDPNQPSTDPTQPPTDPTQPPLDPNHHDPSGLIAGHRMGRVADEVFRALVIREVQLGSSADASGLGMDGSHRPLQQVKAADHLRLGLAKS